VRSVSHDRFRDTCRVLGPLLAILGLALFAIAIGDFFSGFGDFDHGPGLFWLAFLGVPLMGVGFLLTMIGFFGAAARYVAEETRGSVETLVQAAAGGVRPEPQDERRCRKCGEVNDAGARFCKSCGTALQQSVRCPSCEELNEADARFCDACGARLDPR